MARRRYMQEFKLETMLWLVVSAEELLFAATLGLIWCPLYQHLYWRQYLSRSSP